MITITTLYLIAVYFWLSGATTVFLCRLNGTLCSSFARSVLSGLFWPVIWMMLGAVYVLHRRTEKNPR